MDDGTTTYSWDARNRLAALTGAGITATFQYDPVGRRSSKTINGTPTGFLYDGPNPVQELTGVTAPATLLTGLAIDEYLTRTDSTGAHQHFLTDALDSTLALADPAATLQAQYSYEPFGATSVTGATSGNPFECTGRENDGTGLYYYRARYYHPQLSRFIPEDPLEFASGDVNLYAYVGNRPIDNTDPLGLFGIEDLPTIPAPVVNAVAGFGDAFVILLLVRGLLDIDDVVDRYATEYRGGMIAGIVVGSVPFVARGAAAIGGTRIGHILNHNRFLRIGPGRMPAAGRGLPAGTDVPRMSLSRQGLHLDLRSRLPYVPPAGLAERKSC